VIWTMSEGRHGIISCLGAGGNMENQRGNVNEEGGTDSFHSGKGHHHVNVGQ